MKRIIVFALIVVTSMMLAGCKEKEDPKEKEATEDVQKETTDSAEAGAAGDAEDTTEIADTGVDGESVLCTDDKSISIIILRPEGYEDAEFSSEHQVAFQRIEADGVSSAQLNYRLIDGDENSVMTEAQQEVEYIMSANTDGSGVVGEVQSQPVGDRQWSYFTYSYSMEGIGVEGCRIWTSLANGCVLSCTAENTGSGLEPLNVENLLQILSSSIQE